MEGKQTMRLNKIMASLITVMGSQLLIPGALADKIIQKPYGAFYIVSDQEAAKVFDRNNFGFFVLPPSVNSRPTTATVKKSKKHGVKKAVSRKTVTCPPVNCPVTQAKPVTTIEPAESIYLRLEKNKK
ncbi:hypothetical protein [Cronobacter sakazakii]|uniref:hypothetical protein n=2 Tax=Cronobacter sakazakii TaxID=28141 RepID=UPI001EFD0858|nr:hypothetical protein [Cronobacter sakazakii]MDK1224543.1 hypothetical protein [Cronobacter turicensis]MCZ6132185.1 hypothetical protein [Cronobacter sakazakii]MCZ6149284.1 hypothetical protein [Cronobacter sakazakii]MDI7536597.1 hypothetical protein [Cronobacter sakazakii]MDI7540677.1 hypothetical protein [Cronobacter sakazakii]